MILPPVHVGGVVPPTPALVPVLVAPVTPRGSRSWNHVAGTVTGTANYADLNACAWYEGGGWDLRNGRKMRPRGLSGGEDSNERRG